MPGSLAVTILTASLAMRLVRCPAPAGPLDPAPLTCMADELAHAFDQGSSGSGPKLRGDMLSAFWGSDDGYYLRMGRSDDVDAEPSPVKPVVWLCDTIAVADAQVWFRVDPESSIVGAAEGAQVGASDECVGRETHLLRLMPGGSESDDGSTAQTKSVTPRRRRTVYRIVRGAGGTDGAKGRIRILGARAGRSLRRPA